MLRYRALLIDTEKHYERPVQTFCNNPAEVSRWSKEVLRRASDHAWVTVYRVVEMEIGSIQKTDFHYDQSPDPNFAFLDEAAGQPGK